jgi:hypothetical protein
MAERAKRSILTTNMCSTKAALKSVSARLAEPISTTGVIPVYLTRRNVMSIIKIGMLALAPFVLMPLVSGNFKLQESPAVQAIASSDATLVGTTTSHGSVLYKTETDFPDFMKKSSLLATPYPPAISPYRQVSNQTIAAL